MAMTIYMYEPAFGQVLARHSDATIKYYLFRIKWLWKNRKWLDTRQKSKAMEKEWLRYSKAC